MVDLHLNKEIEHKVKKIKISDITQIGQVASLIHNSFSKLVSLQILKFNRKIPKLNSILLIILVVLGIIFLGCLSIFNKINKIIPRETSNEKADEMGNNNNDNQYPDVFTPTVVIKTSNSTPTTNPSPLYFPTNSPSPNTSSSNSAPITSPTLIPTFAPTFPPTSTPTNIPTPTGRFAKIISPNGGETLQQGSNYQITWQTSSDITSVSLLYILSSSPNGANYIVRNLPNTGSYDWNVQLSGVTQPVQVKIELEAHYSTGLFYDQSDNYFAISP